MHVGIFIPARLGSTRLPRKLLLDDTGKPLLAHTIERAQLAQAMQPDTIRCIVCAVDDPQLFDVAQACGAQAVMTDINHTSGTSRIAQAAAEPQYADIDVVVNVQGDEPEMDPEAILTVAGLLEDASDHAPMATLATPIPDESDPRFNDPNTVKCVLSQTGDALYFSRAPVPYRREGATSPIPRGYHHLGIYAYRRDFLQVFGDLPESELEQTEKLEQLRVLDAGYRIRAAVVQQAAPGIDSLQDYEAFVQRVREGKI